MIFNYIEGFWVLSIAQEYKQAANALTVLQNTSKHHDFEWFKHTARVKCSLYTSWHLATLQLPYK